MHGIESQTLRFFLLHLKWRRSILLASSAATPCIVTSTAESEQAVSRCLPFSLVKTVLFSSLGKQITSFHLEMLALDSG